ncbi:hypothetical protein A4A49_03442, partial [Nicotiana attenuata]
MATKMLGEEEEKPNKLDFEETELRLGLPCGGERKKAHEIYNNANGKRDFTEAVELKLNLCSKLTENQAAK